MTPYSALSAAWQALYGMVSILLMIVAVWLLVSVCAYHLNRRFLVASVFLTAVVMFVFQGVSDVSFKIKENQSFTFFADVIGSLPWLAVLAIQILLTISSILFFFLVRRKTKSSLTPGAIKESLDALPDGVCFSDRDGLPLLVNTQMNRLSGELFDSEILNAERFWTLLNQKKIRNGTILNVEPTVVVRMNDGEVWNFHRDTMHVGRNEVRELIANNITTQYCLNRELEERNRSLSRINERLRDYGREVERITTENEILSAKIRVHDDVGQSLLAFRSYQAQPPEERDREQLLFLWRYTVSVLRNEAAQTESNNDWELLLKAAQAIDVTVSLDGELPKDGKPRAVLIAALHECLTNTVKHANGNCLSCSICENHDAFMAELTNNGKPPAGEITETGGLANLRRTVEAAAGSMTILSEPRFLLRLTLPKGEN